MVELRKLIQEQHPAVTEGDFSGTQAPAAAYQASGWFTVESAGCRVTICKGAVWLDLDEETGEALPPSTPPLSSNYSAPRKACLGGLYRSLGGMIAAWVQP